MSDLLTVTEPLIDPDISNLETAVGEVLHANELILLRSVAGSARCIYNNLKKMNSHDEVYQNINLDPTPHIVHGPYINNKLSHMTAIQCGEAYLEKLIVVGNTEGKRSSSSEKISLKLFDSPLQMFFC
ncbi:unnamed protein product [Pieris macdunnoughi]|uniref:Uncharacterized protein n=1 Tax=Pieris macdunnoughi TaxID=345717 RepID=A0A821MYY1_9NEOP|nr:unnamed protein product [Pieris macdunnoughi]